jgi:hypothetical protein
MELYCPIWKAKKRYGREAADRTDFVWKSRMTGRMALQPVTRCRPGVASNSASNTRSDSKLSIPFNRQGHRHAIKVHCACSRFAELRSDARRTGGISSLRIGGPCGRMKPRWVRCMELAGGGPVLVKWQEKLILSAFGLSLRVCTSTTWEPSACARNH